MRRDGESEPGAALGGMRPFVADVLTYEASWLLDVCCRSAQFSLEVLSEARALGRRLEIVGLDRSAEALENARAQAPDDPLIRFVQADACRLPFPDASFDVATCYLAMNAFEPSEATTMLRELRRVTRITPLVCDLERSHHGAIAAATLARFAGRGRPRVDASEIVKRSHTMSELEAFARLAGWKAPNLRRSGLFHVTMRDGD